jgi:glucans biosynthesis protein C
MQNSAMQIQTGTTARPPRIYFIDWLRVITMLCVFIFHNARVFDLFDDWHVKNATLSIGPTVLVALMSSWIMPIFFVLAGGSVYWAFKSRNTGQYVRERSQRLLVPLVFGLIILVAPQAYYELGNHSNLMGITFFQFYPHYLATIPELRTYHLWFLLYLFGFSLVTLPAFLPWGKSGQSLMARLGAIANRPWVLILLLIVPLFLVNITLSPASFWGNLGSGGWNIVSYLLFFLLGYVIFSNAKIIDIFRRVRWIALGTAIVLFIIGMIFLVNVLADEETYFGTGAWAVGQVGQSLLSWSWIIAIIGIGSRYLNGNNRFLVYANEAVLPFYVLHQTMIVIIAFYVVQWDLGVVPKYFIIASASFISIMALYEALVRRINVFRFLFGMRWKKRPQVSVAKASEGL